jgi:hypothetical protein
LQSVAERPVRGTPVVSADYEQEQCQTAWIRASRLEEAPVMRKAN